MSFDYAFVSSFLYLSGVSSLSEQQVYGSEYDAFPAPVSPVITENPGKNSISSVSMSAKFLIYSCFSISVFC